MPKQTFKPGNKAGKGRPPGSRNKIPPRLKEMIVLSLELNGFPRTTWVQATSPAGKRLFEMQDKLDAKGRPIRDQYGKVKRERCRDEFGKPIPIMKRELIFEGAGGALGYLSYLAQEHPKEYVTLLRALPAHRLLVTDADQHDEPAAPDALRAELERGGYSIDDIVSQLEAELRVTDEPSSKLNSATHRHK
jgi:hypothetical protein